MAVMDKLQVRLTPDGARLLLLLLDGTDYDQLTPEDRAEAVVMRKYLAYRVARFWPPAVSRETPAGDITPDEQDSPLRAYLIKEGR